MGIVERRQRHKDEVRKDIICAAWQMVKNEGWQSLSIRKIADAIEYSVPVIYDHFENKEAILIEFAQTGFQKLTDEIIEAKEQHEDGADQIKAIADAYWNFALNNTEHYQLMFGIGMAQCESSQCLPEQMKFADTVMESIQSVIDKSCKNTSACLKYHTFWSVMHGLISIKINGNSVIDTELNKMVLDDAINGFIKNLR
ncbi:TetR/AcrR family transcriptional regulator [Mucilaginibacter agri]|uniref:TetR family transcriptional regulator n=1 Tax=Mucilaginibacter agri TaxID=2695265 RepID=A0A966DRF6_9SPHI|nr:TetR/AcrR family transcriptional regulator [Mucilaginibacter agri]NCD69023.1 TetR family transcriptional regulator [Mucilaginibacter agri]